MKGINMTGSEKVITAHSFIEAQIATITVEDCLPPRQKCASTDKVLVQEVHDELKKHWHLINILSSECKKLEADMELMPEHKRQRAQDVLIHSLKRMRWVQAGFWVACKETYPILLAPVEIGIRSKWELVKSIPQGNPLEELFKSML